jgi:hypothetical protein
MSMLSLSCSSMHSAEEITRAPRQSVLAPPSPLCCNNNSSSGGSGTCDVTVTSSVIGGDLVVTVSIQETGSPAYVDMTISNTLTVNGQTCVTSLQADHLTIEAENTADYYADLHDYEILSAEKDIFSQFGGTITVTPTDGVAGDIFGQAVAMSADGSVIAVGAPHKTTSQGVAYILQRNFNVTTTWPSVQEITDPGATANDQFGSAMGISQDGSVIAIFAGGVGSLYLYTYNFTTNTWSLAQTIAGIAPNLANNCVSVSGSGKYIVVANGAASPSGLVYVRQDNCSAPGATWSLQQTLPTQLALTPLASAAISEDATVVAIGVPFSSPANQGVVYLYGRDAEAITWTLLQILTVPATTEFGFAVSLSSNGQYVLIGSPTTGSGAAYNFVQRGPAWILERTFTPSAGTLFGSAVSISADGTVANISAPSGTGNIQIFFRSPDNTWSPWFTFSGSGGATLGTSAAVSADGAFAVAGAPGAPTAGQVQIFIPVGALVPGNTTVTGNLCVTGTNSITVNNDVFIVGNLTMSGTISTTAVTPCTPSDETMKDDIRDLPHEMTYQLLHQLRPVLFSWKHPEEHREGARRVAGFIAQQIREIFPEWVHEGKATGADAAELSDHERQLYLMIKPEIFALLVSAVRELNARDIDKKERLVSIMRTT